MTDVILVRHDTKPGKTDRTVALFEEMARLDEDPQLYNPTSNSTAAPNSANSPTRGTPVTSKS